ncbi:MAG: ComEC/Rec2 family competence protein [Actinomycetota bacterium]
MTVHLLAGAAALGAWWRFSVGWAVPLIVVAFGWRWHRTATVVVAACLLAGWWSHRAVERFEPPPAQAVSEWVTLTSDPRPSGPVGVRASATWGHHRVSVAAHGPLAGRLDDHLAGERILVVGSFRPVRSGDSWAQWRHEVGSITATEIRDHARGSPLSRFANTLRRVLADGATSMDRDDRAVFSGMVLGDDREQSAVVADDFRAAGLGHLLVVSGQNVAFILALLGPLTRRMRPAGRFGVVCVVLLVFVTLTRFEASVLRASMMAGIGVGAAVLGGPIDGRRALSASVVVLLAVDPFLIRVVAFQLSVLATAGIVWLSGPLAARLRGPELMRVAVATTVSAQLAVSPLLVGTFGPVPAAALPANLLAGAASGPIMMWGWTGGFVAGVLGEPWAGWIHAPTELLVGWVRIVARVTAAAPFASIGAVGISCLGAAMVIALRIDRGRVIAASGAVVVLVFSVIRAPSTPAESTWVAGGVLVHPGDLVVLELHDPHQPRTLLESLRQAGVRRVDVVVARDGDRADADMVVALRARFGDVLVLAPRLHRVPTATSVHPGTVVRIGALVIHARTEGEQDQLVVAWCPGATCEDVPP